MISTPWQPIWFVSSIAWCTFARDWILKSFQQFPLKFYHVKKFRAVRGNLQLPCPLRFDTYYHLMFYWFYGHLSYKKDWGIIMDHSPLFYSWYVLCPTTSYYICKPAMQNFFRARILLLPIINCLHLHVEIWCNPDIIIPSITQTHVNTALHLNFHMWRHINKIKELHSRKLQTNRVINAQFIWGSAAQEIYPETSAILMNQATC